MLLLSTLVGCDQDWVGQEWSPIRRKAPPYKVVQDTPHKRAHEPSPLATTPNGSSEAHDRIPGKIMGGTGRAMTELSELYNFILQKHMYIRPQGIKDE